MGSVNPRMEHSSFLHLVLLLAILVILRTNQVNATKFPSDKGARPTVHPTSYDPWYSTTRPWWSTTWDPYTTTRHPWYSTTRSPWDTTTRPWYTTTRPWRTTTRDPWYSTTRRPHTTDYTTYNPYTTTPYPSEGCPQGWIDSIEGCFLFQYDRYVTWHEAQYECEKVGGFLVEPKTQRQQHMLKSLAFVEHSFTGVGSWWIGLTDEGHEGRWIWQHSTENANTTDWIWDCPVNGVNNLDCAMMEKILDYHWRDAVCTNRAAPICQREQTNPTPTPGPYPTSTWRPWPTTSRRPYPTTKWPIDPTSTGLPYPTSTWRPYTTNTWWRSYPATTRHL